MNQFVNRNLVEAIDQNQYQLITDNKGYLIGQGVMSPWYVGGSTSLSSNVEGAVFDTPISESCVTGMCLGIAATGKNIVVVHPRMDFMWYAMDAIVNGLATFSQNFSKNFFELNYGKIIIRAIINRGSSQGAQHSQALHTVFCHIPGLHVYFPATPSCVDYIYQELPQDHACICIEDRKIYTNINRIAFCDDLSDNDCLVRKSNKSDILIIGTAPVLAYLNEIYEDDNLNECPNFLIVQNLKLNLADYIAHFTCPLQIILVDESWSFCGLVKEWYFQVSRYIKGSDSKISIIAQDNIHYSSIPGVEDKLFAYSRLKELLVND